MSARGRRRDRPVVDVAQIGARERYAVPKAIHDLGMLRYLHTDLYFGRGSRMCPVKGLIERCGIGWLRRLRSRKCDLPPDVVRAQNGLGLRRLWRLRGVRSAAGRMRVHEAMEREFALGVLKGMKSMPDAIVGFRGSSHLFESGTGRFKCILDQIDGGIHEVDVVREEQRKNVDWVTGTPDWMASEANGDPYWMDVEGVRLKREWGLSDVIVCNSEWTVQCLKAVGVAESKLRIIPIPFDPPPDRPPSRRDFRRGSLRVGFLGTLTLRKGIHHLLRAARLASEDAAVKVLCAGPSEIDLARLDEFAGQVEYRGRIARSEIGRFFEECDVLALPSLSEGFGIVQLEAMALGIPVIASDRTGDVVIDGVNGLRVRAGDVEGLASAMLDLSGDPDRLEGMSAAARERVKVFSSTRVRELWRQCLIDTVEGRPSRVHSPAAGDP